MEKEQDGGKIEYVATAALFIVMETFNAEWHSVFWTDKETLSIVTHLISIKEVTAGCQLESKGAEYIHQMIKQMGIVIMS